MTAVHANNDFPYAIFGIPVTVGISHLLLLQKLHTKATVGSTTHDSCSGGDVQYRKTKQRLKFALFARITSLLILHTIIIDSLERDSCQFDLPAPLVALFDTFECSVTTAHVAPILAQERMAHRRCVHTDD